MSSASVTPQPVIASPHPDDYATKFALRTFGVMGTGFGLYAAMIPDQARDIFAVYTTHMRDLQLFGWLLFLVGCRSIAASLGSYADQRKTLQFFMVGLGAMVIVFALGTESSELNEHNRHKSMIAAGANLGVIAVCLWACYFYKRGQGTNAIMSEPNLPMSRESGVKTFLRIHHTVNMVWGFAHLVIPEVLRPWIVIGHSQIIGMRALGCLFILWALADIAAIRSEYSDQKRALSLSLLGITANTYLLYNVFNDLPASDPRYQLLMPNMVVMGASILAGVSLLAFSQTTKTAAKKMV
jgi:hypothetical protein